MHRFFQAAIRSAKKIAPITGAFGAGVGATKYTVEKMIEIDRKPADYTEENHRALAMATFEGFIVGGTVGAAAGAAPAALVGGLAAVIAFK